MMSLICRPVAAKDIPLLCTFPCDEEELFFMFPKANWPLTPAQLQASIDSRADSTVVEEAGHVLGFANFYKWENGGVCTIGNLIVAPYARGKGVASFILREMVRLAQEKYQAKEVTLSCFSTNIAGLLLYPKLGFVPYAIEERLDKAGQKQALVHMRFTPSR